MIKCIEAFARFMNDKYNVNIHDFRDSSPRVVLFNIMNEITSSPASASLQINELNNTALHTMRDYYISKYSIIETKKPNVRSLDRERQIHGERPISDIQIKPMFTNNREAPVHQDFERIVNIRKAENENDSKVSVEKPLTEVAMSKDEFQVKLEEFEKRRNDTLTNNIELLKTQDTSDPKQFFAQVLKANNDSQKQLLTKQNVQALSSAAPVYENHNQRDLVTFTSKIRKSPNYYITINGFDRNWQSASQKARFQFSVDMTSMSRTYKNVHEMAITKLIIPSEIVEERTLTNIPKANYAHKFKFGYPYLLLMIDEFQDMYDGVNPANKRAFTQFIYDTDYQAPNGRGYIILSPTQDERKVFYPSPLSSLQRLTFTVAKPNGMPFNNSRDIYAVWKVEYEAYNQMYLKIVLDKFFDKNEFFTGDIVLMRDYKMPVYDSNTSPEYADYQAHKNEYDRIMEFISRPEGHEIVEIGTANTEGFYRNFYIHAPNLFDMNLGKYVIEKALVDRIQAFNDQNYRCCQSPMSNGGVINTSLQLTLNMQVKLAIGDAVEALTPQLI